MAGVLTRFNPGRLLERGRRWLARREGGGQVRSAGDFAAALGRSREVLESFGRKSDCEFTELAKELGRFSGNLTGLRQKAGQLSAVIEDRDEDRALSAAYALYKGSVDLVHASLGVAVSEQEQMQAIEKDLLLACASSAHFERNDMMLRILTLNIRMEAVRLEAEQQSVFLNVAANIGEIAQKVLASSAAAFGRIEAIVVEAAAERDELRRLEETLHRRAHRSVETIFRELEKLKAALAPCGERSRAIEQHLEATAPLTLKMLMALQHQDIVRQKLEHIGVGFQDMGSRLTGALATPGADGAFVHQAAAVQSAQLGAARREIEDAGREVTGGMEELLRHGKSIMDAYVGMETSVLDAFRDCRLADLYREQITELATIAAQGQGTNEKVACSVSRIEEVVRLFSQEIARQEFDVKIVSLNAQIAAARMTGADALNKISEECSRVSDEIGRITAELTARLDGILTALQQISAQAASFLGIVSREKTTLEKGAITVSEQLRRLSERTQAEAVATREAFSTLFGDTSELLARLTFPQLIATSFDPAERLCEELRESTAHSAGLPLDTAGEAKLAAHRDRYTMDDERRAHADVVGGAFVSGGAPVAVELFGTDTDAGPPGAEVELFDDFRDTSADTESAGSGCGSAGSDQTPDKPRSPDPKPDLGPGIELF